MKKRVFGVLLCMMLLFSAFSSSTVAEAADVTDCFYQDISSYRVNGNSYPTKKGYVFAGWYEDAEFTKPLGIDVTKGKAYAKFVNENVLTVKCQINAGTKITSSSTDLRLLTTVDSLNYQSVGFDVTVGSKTVECVSNRVYTTIYGFVNSSNEEYRPGLTFSADSLYFMAYKIKTVPNASFKTTIHVTPKWLTLDGTTVTGTAKSFTINEGIGNEYIEEPTYGTVWSVPSTVKIEQDNTSYANKGKAQLSYHAVRNEYESYQLLITAEKAIKHFELKTFDLTYGSKVLSSDDFTVYVQKYIPYNDYYGEGNMPDALIPMEAADDYGENAIAVNTNGALWVTVYVPKTTVAGTYTGTFQLIMEGDEGVQTEDIPVSVTVYNYTLADEGTAKTLFSWRYERVAAGELNGSIDMMTKYYEFFQDYNISLQSLPLETLSGEEYVDAIEKYYNQLTTYSILSEIGDVSTDLYNKEAQVREQILEVAAASTSDKNLFEKAMIYCIDEPDLSDATVRTKIIANIEKLDGILQGCVDTIDADTTGTYTEFKKINNWQSSILDIPNIVPITQNTTTWLLNNKDNTDVKAVFEVLNCIAPYFTNCQSSQYDILVGLCETYNLDLWWYGCLYPRNPAPTYHIGDSNLLSSRTVSWLQSKFDVQGNLYWDAAAYTDESSLTYNQYINVFEQPYRNTEASFPAGDGFLTYPGAAYDVDGPLPSMRLMSIRDGMEEYEILEVLKDAGVDVDTYYDAIASDVTDMYVDGENVDFTTIRTNLLKQIVKSKPDASTPTASDSGSQESGTTEEDSSSNVQVASYTTTESNTELIFSFESYKDITETGIRLGNQFGATKVNKDQQLITEGAGSWMVQPQGDYGKQNVYPYFQAACKGTTFKTNDFAAYDKVMMDVYNVSDEEVEIKLQFNVLNQNGGYSNTEGVVYTLKPNSWTTCDYYLTGLDYSVNLDMSDVQYMKVTFLSVKDSKSDTVPTLYLDNLRGHVSQVTRESATMEANFDTGVTFENAMEKYNFFGNYTGDNTMSLSRVAYAKTSITADKETYGKYALKGTTTSAMYPMLDVDFGKTYDSGKKLCFDIYIEGTLADASVTDQRCKIEFKGKEGTTQTATYSLAGKKLNQWVTIEIPFTAAHDNGILFANFEDSTTGKSFFGDNKVNIYMDNFCICDSSEGYKSNFTEGITFGPVNDIEHFVDNYTGVNAQSLERVAYASTAIASKTDVATYGGYGMMGTATGSRYPLFRVYFDKSYPAGTKLRFSIYIDGTPTNTTSTDPRCKVEMKGQNTGSSSVSYSLAGKRMNTWVTDIEYTFKSAHDSADIFLNFDSSGTSIFGSSEVKIYYDNFVLIEKDFTSGISLEYEDDTDFFADGYTGANAMSISRVAYTNTTIGSQASEYGSYALLGTATGSKYPMFAVDFGKTYAAGTKMSFRVYIEGTPTDTTNTDQRCKVELYGYNGGTRYTYTALAGKKLNTWVTDIEYTFTAAHDSAEIFLNFNNSSGVSIFGDGEVKIYFDNFKVSENASGRIISLEDTLEKDFFADGYTGVNAMSLSHVAYANTTVGTQESAYGKYALLGTTTSKYPMFAVDFGKTYAAGTKLSFRVYIEGTPADTTVTDQRCKVEFQGYNGNTKTTYTALTGKKLNTWITDIEYTFTSDHDSGVIFFNFDSAGQSIFGNNKVKIYMDNFVITESE